MPGAHDAAREAAGPDRDGVVPGASPGGDRLSHRGWVAVAAAAAVTALVAVVVVPRLGGDARPLVRDQAAARSPSASPKVHDTDPGLAAQLGDVTTLQQTLARSDVLLLEVQQTSPTDAAALLGTKSSPSEYQSVVLSTIDNWASATGALVPGDVEIQALPGGGVAVRPDTDDPNELDPFILRRDGTVIVLRITRAPRVPGPGSLLVDPPQWVEDEAPWVLDPTDAASYPMLAQPRRWRNWEPWRQGPVSDADGTTLMILSHCCSQSGTIDRLLVAHSRSTGRRWRTTRLRAPGGEYVGEGAAGPHGELAFATFEEKNFVDGAVLHGLYISHDGRTWRQVSVPDQGYVMGLAFTPDGTLLLLNWDHRGLLRVRSGGSSVQPVRHGPRAYYLESSGGFIIAHTGDNTAAVSTDGRRWQTIRPRTAEVRATH